MIITQIASEKILNPASHTKSASQTVESKPTRPLEAGFRSTAATKLSRGAAAEEDAKCKHVCLRDVEDEAAWRCLSSIRKARPKLATLVRRALMRAMLLSHVSALATSPACRSMVTSSRAKDVIASKPRFCSPFSVFAAVDKQKCAKNEPA